MLFFVISRSISSSRVSEEEEEGGGIFHYK